MNGLQDTLGRVVLCVTMVSAVTAYAAKDGSDLPDALLKCVSIQDDTERLDCFDKGFASLAPSTETVPDTSAEIVPDAKTAANTTISVQDEVAPAAAVAVSAAQAQPDVSSKHDTVENFGLSAKIDENAIHEITAIVTDVRKRGYGQLVVTLDNGHVWTEKDPVQGFRVREGDTLTIRKGTFGGFRMVTSGNRSSPAIRME